MWHVYAEPPNRYPPHRSGALTSDEEEPDEKGLSM